MTDSPHRHRAKMMAQETPVSPVSVVSAPAARRQSPAGGAAPCPAFGEAVWILELPGRSRTIHLIRHRPGDGRSSDRTRARPQATSIVTAGRPYQGQPARAPSWY